MSAGGNGSSGGSLHRISEDSRFRPFLTSHFDAEGFTRAAIRDGRSEDVFRDLDGLVGEVNDAIKGFVAVHKHDLMGGMQDVAVLASRYHSLQALSSRAKMSVERLKKDTVEVHDLLRARTSELERIHATSTMLRQLRQFAHALAQLNHYINEEPIKDKSGPKDIRQYVAAAKILYELEQFLDIPQLHAVSLVSSNASTIRAFGRRLRDAARTRLLSALRERNQAAVADCLQIFFNLDSLPEIVLLAVDNVVKSAADISMASIDLEVLIAIAPELAATNTVASSSSLTSMGAIPSTPIRSSSSSSALTGGGGSAASASAVKKGAEANANRVASQLRGAMREIGHLWSTKLFENTLQIHVLQRVVSKKEDPATHKKFLDVLKAAASASPRREDATSPAAVGLAELASGDLVELFYARLVVTLHDVIADKIRKYPVAAARIYPSLRRAAAEATNELNNLSSRITGSEDVISLLSRSGANSRSQNRAGGAASSAVFGSLGWSLHDSAVGQLGFAPGLHAWSVGSEEDAEVIANGESLIREMDALDDVEDGQAIDREVGGNGGQITSASDALLDKGFIGGLRPMRDRYLIGVLSRITAPIHQMFPELEGYVAAVPSKRDLQSFVKVVFAELVDGGTESNPDLMRHVCKEVNKAVQLLVTKIEGMIQNIPDIKKLDAGKSFARNGAQEHNAQLVTLIAQLREALEKLPGQVRKALDDGGVPSGADSSSAPAMVEKIIASFNSMSIQRLDDLASRQLLNPIVDCITDYARGLLIPMLREAAVSSGGSSPAAASMSPTAMGALEMGSSDCSKAVQTLLKQIPDIVRIHLQSFPHMPSVVWSVEELSRRLLFSFMSVVVLVRPVTELSRLRAAADMTALEVLTSTLRSATGVDKSAPSSSLVKRSVAKAQQSTDAVKAEFVGLRRLLFEECISSPASSVSKAPQTPVKGGSFGGSSAIPSKEAVLALPYLSALRPSTVLGYMFACGPSQLSPAYEMTSSKSVADYLSALCASAAVAGAAPAQLPLLNVAPMDSDLSASAAAGLFQALSITQGYRSRAHWNSNSAEAEAWRLMQRSLDVLFQRSGVAADESARASLRSWHATLTGLGEAFFPPMAPAAST